MAQKPTRLTFPSKPRNLIIGDELNRGAWGAVYNGDLEGRPVAVKRIHELLHQEGGEEERRKLFEDFREECKKLQALNHPHVVGFIGAFNDSRLGPILVMEKMQENLRQFLGKWKKKLQLPKQLRISLEIITGVAFLHQQTPPLVHRDLNDKNVMFSFEGVVKIGDFGQSKLKKDLYLTTGQPGMVTFMPPEALDADKSKYNESLDIFSVGVLMLEIGTQQEPLVNLRGIGIIREVERRERDLKVLGEDHPLRRPVLLCLKDNPKERPKASDLQKDVLAIVDGVFEATANELRSQITSLQATLEGASKEIAARKEHEATLTSQLQADVASRDANIRRLEERCAQLEAQATTYKLDFEQERSDREEMAGRFEGERETFQANIVKLEEKLKAMQLEHDNTSLAQRKEEVLPQSPLPPSLGKEVHSIKLPNMPMGRGCASATIHKGIVYICGGICESDADSTSDTDSTNDTESDNGDSDEQVNETELKSSSILVYSTNEHKWNIFKIPGHHKIFSAIAVVNNHITLIGGCDQETGKVTSTVSTWNEEEGQWTQVLPPMPTRRFWATVISHNNLLLVTGGVSEIEDVSTVLNTTDVLDLTTMKWTTPEGLSLPIPLWLHHLALCGEYLYLVGGCTGYDDDGTPIGGNSQAWRANWSDVLQTAVPQHSQPQRGVWRQIADPPTPYPSVVSCGGTLYVVGGEMNEYFSGVYAYNTITNRWISVGDMSVGRVGLCAVPLSSTTMFVSGGFVLVEGNAAITPLTEILLL